MDIKRICVKIVAYYNEIGLMYEKGSSICIQSFEYMEHISNGVS